VRSPAWGSRVLDVGSPVPAVGPGTDTGEPSMGQTDDRLAVAMAGGRGAGHRRGAHQTAGHTASALPDELTWSATLDPQDDMREVEITEEMVRHAIAAIEREQVFPFGAETGAPPPVARTVSKAKVLPFPSRKRAG